MKIGRSEVCEWGGAEGWTLESRLPVYIYQTIFIRLNNNIRIGMEIDFNLRLTELKKVTIVPVIL